MASTYSTNLAIELIGTGDQAGTWGTTTNSNLGTLIEQSISGYVTQAVSTGTDTTITIPNGSTGVARNMYIELTGTGGASTNLIVPANKKLYFIFNNSTGAVTVKVSGQTGVSVPTGKKMVLVSNGTDIVNGLNFIADFGTNSFTVTNLTASSATITNLIATSGSITNLVSSDASATVLRAGSATLTHLSATSATITNLTLTSLVISNLSIASANITTLTGSTQTLSSNLTLSGGTANGVAFLNASKVVTSGSVLVFDGTYFTANGLRLAGTDVTNTIYQATGTLGISTGSASGIVFSTNLVNRYSIDSTGVAVWSISGSESMRLNATGLGIGTASPTQKLTVNGNAAVGGQQYFWFRDDDGFSGSVTRRAWAIGANVDVFGALSFKVSTAANGNPTTGTTVACLDSSGNLGIGTTSPVAKLNVSVADSGNVVISNTNDGHTGGLAFGDASSNSSGRISYDHSSNAMRFDTNGTERARITSGGDFLIGTTDSSVSSGIGFKYVSSATDPYIGIVDAASTSAVNNYHLYSTGASAYRFYVGLNGTINATNTSISAISDIRLKENIRDLDVGLDAVMSLKPRKFDWKEGKGANTKDARGFIAQEFEQVFPDLIGEWLDPAPEGEEPYKSVRQDLIPVLVKAIQEQQAIITALTARITALESK